MNDDQFKKIVAESKKIVFFTGAGFSTESGVPDFRSPNGIWSKYKPVYYNEFIQSSEARKRHWQMKAETHALYKDVTPNQGHIAINHFQQTGQLLGVITQNIDGLHQESGTPKEKVCEIHGTDREGICLECGLRHDINTIFTSLENQYQEPRCNHCDGLVKVATISFGQQLDPNTLKQAEEWCMECDICIILGSSLVVQPAASLPVLAKQHFATIAIINLTATPLDSIADFTSTQKTGVFMQTLIN